MPTRKALSLSLGLALATALLFVPNSVAQIQSTITCQSGNWDVLSLMMMDPTLTPGYHMEGDYTGDLPGSYMYTAWSQSDTKVWYIKNPQGNPWDINLYDTQPGIASQGYVYQWVTEVDNWPNPNSPSYWNDPKSCKKFNNGFDNSDKHDSDESFRWAPRCGVPDGANSSYWNQTPTPQPPPDYNSNYYVYIDQVLQSDSYNLKNALVELKGPGTIAIYWGGSNSTETWTANTISVQYTYTCSQQNVNYCTDREVFDYAYDVNPNPQDGLKHAYGWVQWRHYKNSSSPGDPANWGTPVAQNLFNHVVSGQTTANFQCF